MDFASTILAIFFLIRTQDCVISTETSDCMSSIYSATSCISCNMVRELLITSKSASYKVYLANFSISCYDSKLPIPKFTYSLSSTLTILSNC